MKKYKNQTFSWDFNDYKDLILYNCKIIWDFNKVGVMIWGKVIWDFNEVSYVSGVKNKGDFNKFKNHFDYQEEKQISHSKSNLPEDIREAMDIRNQAMEFQKEVIKGTAEIEKRKNDYYKKYWKWHEKGIAYFYSFYK